MVTVKGVPTQPSAEVGVTVYVNVAGEFVSLNNVCPNILC